MLIEDAVTYLVLFVLGSAIGIPFGSWLNSKLLTRTWKGELDKAKEEVKESEEYKMTMELVPMLKELVTNLNGLLKSEEARNFFANTSKALKQLTGKGITISPSGGGDDMIKLPEKPTEPRKNEGDSVL